jgi:hypothetical protein
VNKKILKGELMKQELLKGLTEEQIAKVKACKNHEELLAIAKAEGIQLTDEQLAAISGGGACSVVSDIGDYLNTNDCPKCGCNDYELKNGMRKCKKCGYKWNHVETD